MPGFVCIAMQKMQPYKIVVGVTELEPEIWIEELSPPGHLLCYEGFRDHVTLGTQLVGKLAEEGIIAEYGEAFSAKPVDVIRVFLLVRDDAIRLRDKPVNNADSGLVGDFADGDEFSEAEDEGKLLYDLAQKCEANRERAFRLYCQSTQTGYKCAYIALADAYLNGYGTVKDLTTASNWAIKLIQEGLGKFDAETKLKAGELFHNLATEYENGCDQTKPDTKKAFQLNIQSAKTGYSQAYTSLACAYLAGVGVAQDLNAALEWAMREIDAEIIYGYNHATTCLIQAGMKQQAEYLWKRCFREHPVENIATSCLRIYIKQISKRNISIDSDIREMFDSLAKCLGSYQEELGVTLYSKEIAWLVANA